LPLILPLRGGGEFDMASSNYHRRQAAVLMRLAQNTTDPATAQHLAALAAEHTKLADDEVMPLPATTGSAKPDAPG
jgi:hypothetical protein